MPFLTFNRLVFFLSYVHTRVCLLFGLSYVPYFCCLVLLPMLGTMPSSVFDFFLVFLAAPTPLNLIPGETCFCPHHQSLSLLCSWMCLAFQQPAKTCCFISVIRDESYKSSVRFHFGFIYHFMFHRYSGISLFFCFTLRFFTHILGNDKIIQLLRDDDDGDLLQRYHFLTMQFVWFMRWLESWFVPLTTYGAHCVWAWIV